MTEFFEDRKPALQEARDECSGDGQIIVCHGPPRCDRLSLPVFEPCEWCLRFYADDPRTTDEIIAQLERNH